MDRSSNDSAIATVTADERHLNPGGTVHGDAMATLVDVAMGAVSGDVRLFLVSLGTPNDSSVGADPQWKVKPRRLAARQGRSERYRRGVSRRRILHLTGSDVLSVATEATFESEERLHSAIALHPEVLPSEDVGLGPLVTVANELDLGHGPMDTLAVDSAGRLAIIEFKRGTENPDVRKVVAQILDYGSALWRLPYDDLEAAARVVSPGFSGSLVEHIGARLNLLGFETFDVDAFRRGVESALGSGEFVFLYVARDLDARTKRIMTYLAEGPKMTFFAVEVDYFVGTDGDAVLVPRVAFVPSWVTDPQPAVRRRPEIRLGDAPEPVQRVARLMEPIVERLGVLETRHALR